MGPQRDQGPDAKDACGDTVHVARGGQHFCERKAAHHAASVEVLAGEASEDRARCWSRQDCTVFRKELEWELQAFSRANAELELLVLPIDKRQAAHLRAEKVDAAAHYARQVVERVLWDHDHGWEEPQRFGLDHHQPIRPEESCEQGGRRGLQASSVADGEGGPQRVVQVEDEIFFQVSRAFGIPQKKHLYFISVSGAFLGTSLPPTPN
jgi:hypothetical protein